MLVIKYGIINDLQLYSLAAQWWFLARTFPLMIGDMIPENNQQWESYVF